MSTPNNTTTYTGVFLCTSINAAESGRVTVVFQQVQPETTDATTAPPAQGNLSFVVPSEEAAGYFPGKLFDLSLTKQA